MKKISIAVAVLLIVFLGYVALQPADYKIAREIHIKATPEKIFPYLNSTKLTNDWMPWKESDPQVQMSYSGAEVGVGSISSWDSQGKMGTGKAEVVDSIPNQSVKTKITYAKPMVMEQLSEFSVQAKDDGTLMRWSVEGKNTFMGRLFCVFMNMDKMVGGEFEKGLNKLKTTVEAQR